MKHTDKQTLQKWTFEAVPREEQETTIVIDHKGKRAMVYSCHPSTIEKIREWVKENEESAQLRSYDRYGINATVPISWVKLKSPRKYTEEQKKEMRDRLKKRS